MKTRRLTGASFAVQGRCSVGRIAGTGVRVVAGVVVGVVAAGRAVVAPGVVAIVGVVAAGRAVVAPGVVAVVGVVAAGRAVVAPGVVAVAGVVAAGRAVVGRVVVGSVVVRGVIVIVIDRFEGRPVVFVTADRRVAIVIG